MCAAGKNKRVYSGYYYHRNKGIFPAVVLGLFAAILILIFVTFRDNKRKEGKSEAVATADVMIELHCERYWEDELYVDSMYGYEWMDGVLPSNSTSATKIKKSSSTKVVILSLSKLECFLARKAP